jgi:hypothetical protein
LGFPVLSHRETQTYLRILGDHRAVAAEFDAAPATGQPGCAIPVEGRAAREAAAPLTAGHANGTARFAWRLLIAARVIIKFPY